MPDDPVTLGELGRRMDRAFTDLKEDIHDIVGRLDKKVSEDVYELRQRGIEDRIAAIERGRSADAQQRVAERRWRIASVVIPITLGAIAALVAIVVAIVG